MTLSQDQFDDLVQRTALASLFYYPEIAVDDSEYNLQKDIDYCIEPVAALSEEDLKRLRVVVGRLITNPSGHRAELIELVIELAPGPADT
jgi:hypothetical protein